MPNPKPQIYISSTFFDLRDHRKYLIQALRKTERFDIVCMEDYGTRSHNPLDVCLKGVAEAEFYILLLGNRYGFVPENQQLSITNLEYKTAINDSSPDIAGSPNTTRCVLPFLADPNLNYTADVLELLKKEETNDGEQFTLEKKEKLRKWKEALGRQYTLDEPFTTPSDLTAKVFGALIPELINRDYADVVKKLVFPDDLKYRCNRNSVRNEFLSHNVSCKTFFKVFLVHGEVPELPVVFSNNIVEYELSARETALDLCMDDYAASTPDKFLEKFVIDSYYNIFKEPLNLTKVCLESLAQRMIEDKNINNVVLIYDMEFSSWKNKYKKFLHHFFSSLEKANTGFPETQKNCYILLNIKYSSTKEKVKESPAATIILDKLSRVTLEHVRQWIRTYFLKNQKKDAGSRNSEYERVQKLMDRYFTNTKSKKEFTMEEIIPMLEVIIDDFNKNQNAFSDYNKIISK